ncbi:G-protein coupled receptor Mth-like 10-like 3 [Homarus americanus]|uniref:G-protein coupled receptor Mth-like 10-like 3 n=1 Tax=Homarus americanus TaxID=6706 RepID=A0A8J5N629_HOMAM|nr:G-protein coupled receptor Mth-like 10-like 3 [Homarus americanus]
MTPAPCSCEADCGVYGDCCQDATAPAHTNLSTLPHPHKWSCRTFTSKHLCPHSVYAIDWCPENTNEFLATRCAGLEGHHTFLQDILVKSTTSGIVYGNIFCALCHQDAHQLNDLNAIMQCIIADGVQLRITNRKFFAKMNYHAGKLQWTTTLTQELVTTYLNSSFDKDVNKTVECALYYDIAGHPCDDVHKSCADGWTQDDTRQSCASYTYHVYTAEKIFKNWDCAICNYVPVNNIKCSPYPKPRTLICSFPPSSVNDLFKVYGECQEPQVWNPLSGRCEAVRCGSLYKLVRGECVRDNSQMIGRFSINSSCFTRDYDRNLSVTFPNLTIYLNTTGTTHHRGEYEFVDKDFVRVCRPQDTVPVLGVVSTVFMSLSLFCMFLHMCIFFCQYKRRSIPRLTHFLMVFSLFIAELFLLITFNANDNYVACVVYASIMYYFFSVAFFWMNVISFDTCRAFCSHTYVKSTIKTFIGYFVYTTTVPLLMTVTAVVVDLLSPPDFVLRPDLGTGRCWFNNKWGLVLFFICPVFLILIIDFILYIIAVYEIYKQQKSAEFASRAAIKNNKRRCRSDASNKRTEGQCEYPPSSAVTSRSTTPDMGTSAMCLEELPGRGLERQQKKTQHLKVVRDRVVIYSKVALIMGMTWVFALVSLFVESSVVNYCNVFFNCLQGTFIFISFDCTKENINRLRYRLTGYSSNQDTVETV